MFAWFKRLFKSPVYKQDLEQILRYYYAEAFTINSYRVDPLDQVWVLTVTLYHNAGYTRYYFNHPIEDDLKPENIHRYQLK